MALVLVPAAILLVNRRGWRMLRSRPALLVPLGFRVLAVEVVLLVLPRSAKWVWGINVAPWVLVLWVIYVLYAAWVTPMLRGKRHLPVVRFALCMGFGHGVLLLVANPILHLVRMDGWRNPVGLVLLGLWALIWNLLTAPLLLVVADRETSLLRVLPETWRAFRRGVRHWWWPVLAQMLLLGVWVHLNATVVEAVIDGEHIRTTRTHIRANTVTAFWTGAYRDDCKWYTVVLRKYELPEVRLVSLLFLLAFAVLALTTKLTVVKRL